MPISQPRQTLSNRDLLRPTVAAVVSVSGANITVNALLDTLGGYEEYTYPGIGAAHLRAGDVVIVLYRSDNPKHGVVLGDMGSSSAAGWHTHLMGVDSGTRVIADDYSLVVPRFIVEDDEVLEIEDSGALLIV